MQEEHRLPAPRQAGSGVGGAARDLRGLVGLGPWLGHGRLAEGRGRLGKTQIRVFKNYDTPRSTACN